MEPLTWTILLSLAAITMYIFFCQRRNAEQNGIPPLSIGYRHLMTLRLSTICSAAYAECRQRRLAVARFRLFVRPVVFVSDPHVLKCLVNDWRNFRNRGSYHNNPTAMENMHLFNLKDDQWKASRSSLGKCFAPDKLRSTLEVFDASARHCLDELSDAQSGRHLEMVDIFKVAHKFSYLVASHMFLSHDARNKDVHTAFDKLYNPGWFNKFVDVFGYVCPSVLQWFNVCDIPRAVFENLEETLLREIHSDNTRNSLLSELLEDGKIRQEEYIGQMIGLFVGSLKSTTTFVAYACYELAKAPHLQDRVNQEISSIQANADFTYENLQEMTFMRHVLNETLRLHSGGPLLIRECNNSTALHLGGQGKVKIECGSLIFASLRDILNDEEYFQHAHTFDPDRFENHKGHTHFWPFGLGRHVCIGNKFVVLQAQVFLIRLLRQFRISINENCERNLEAGGKRLTDGVIYLNFTLAT